ncbi:hypothetical protein BH20ACT15_BH20ACT15_04620 [soil metagenome]
MSRRLPPPPPPSGPADEPPAPAGGRFPAWVNWTPRDVAVGLLVGLIGGFLFAPALVLPFDPDLSSDSALLAAQTLLSVTLTAVAIAVASGWKRVPLREVLPRLGFRRFSADAIGWMFLMIVVYYVAAGLFAYFVLEPKQEDIGDALGVGDETLLISILAVVLIAGLAPIAEETFFRGFVFGGLRTKMSLWPAALIAGLIFGSIHAPTGVTTVVPLAGLGVGLCWLYDKTNSLWPCVIAHAINNGLALAIAGSDSGFLHLPFA